ncbi:MAG: hypothetical protein JKX81_14340 [Arenicella sp.]|nr:hypothetical protein [Arenicella sp.]
MFSAKPIKLSHRAILVATATLLGAASMSLQADTGSAITSAELTQDGYAFPSDLSSSATHTEKANYAWRLFIAAMQNTTATLSSGAGRTAGASNSDFIDSGNASIQTNPLVFESFYHRTEAFPYYQTTKPASPVGQIPTYYTYYQPTGGSDTALTVTGENYVYLDETNEIGQNYLYFKDSNSPDFPVLFMAKVNTSETNYVRGKTTSPSNTSSYDFPDNVMEVKTAWRRVSDINTANSTPSSYHQAMATYYKAGSDGVPHVVNEMFALIGVHIILKTANYQQFIFSTFEHVDSVTRNGSGTIIDPAYETTYNSLAYNNGVSDPTVYKATATGAYDVNAAGQSGSATNQQTTYNLPLAGTISQSATIVVQPQTITKEVNDVNNSVTALISGLSASNVWANYRLKGIQAGPTSDQTAEDYYLANIVIESSQPGIQLFTGTLVNGGVPVDGLLTNNRTVDGTYTTPLEYGNVSPSAADGGTVAAPTYTVGGCQGCHGAAQQKGRDFSFLAQASVGVGKELDTVPAGALNTPAAAAHKANIAENREFQ